jgi:hypothetical protein
MVQPSKPQKYFELTKKKLYKRLEARGYSAGTIYNLIDRAQVKRKAVLKAERMRHGVYAPWNVMIEELLAEMHRTRAKIDKYTSEKHNHPERAELFSAYLQLLQKRLYGLRLKQQREKQTPEALGKPHWSDWIPEEVKRPFIQRHTELFNKANTRTAAPLFSNQKVIIQTQKSKRVAAWKQEWLQYMATYDDAAQSRDEAKAEWAKYCADCIERCILRLEDVGIRRASVEWVRLLTAQESAEMTRLGEAFTTKEETVVTVALRQ